MKKADCRGTRWCARFAKALCLMLCAVLWLPAALAEGETIGSGPSVVRVGWYDSSYNSMNKAGRRTGYGYEYQQKIAAYTGWKYEYVTGGWSELLAMLERGEIDLLSDVSRTVERESRMLFSTFPMGTEEYFIFKAPGNPAVMASNYDSLNGKRVGVNKGSVQADYYQTWASRQGITAEIVEVTGTEEESLRMLEDGTLDAYVTVDSFKDPDRAEPVCKVGSSDYYFAVNNARPDLLNALDDAMNRIQDENRYYNHEMYEKYMRRSGANTLLAEDALSWLAEHGTIRVGYLDDYLAFCDRDGETGALNGVLKDFLAYASSCMANARLRFETMAYPTAAAAIGALERGEVDCVFPVSLMACDGEAMGLSVTPPLLGTDIYAAALRADQQMFNGREHVIVAVGAGDLNLNAFLLDHFPDWRRIYFSTTEECLEAVADGVADCVLFSNYRHNNLARLLDSYRLTTLNTGAEMDCGFAVRGGETGLYSLLSKVIGAMPSAAINTVLSYYTSEDARFTLADFLRDNMIIVMAVTGVLLLIILALMGQSIRSERRAKKLISATETDELTGLYNRNFFFQYADQMHREHPDTPMDAIVVNIEQFHSVNALKGRPFGDQVLCALGGEIRVIARETKGIAGRFEADRFDIYCRHTREYQAIYDRLQAKLDALDANASLRIRMGVMPWQEKLEPEQLFDMARTACSMARGHYKEHLIVFDEKVREREIYEQRLLNDLRPALEEYQFEVYYQPKYNIQADPPCLVSAEALIRWRHPELGMVSPGDFIPLFERSGQINLVDKYVWAEAARQIARWREQYGVIIPVSVNLSRVDVFDPELENILEGILEYNGLEHNALKLEVTESAYTENADQVIRVVENLRNNGFQVEMDDFGSGYSSLNMLSAMPIDVLKMDQGFIRNIENDEKGIQLVALILDIAQSLQIPVVAEGVENERQMKLLKDLGCALVQGYYFSRPLHPTDFESKYFQSGETEER